MKKLFCGWMTILVISLMSMCFTACGSSSNGGDGSGGGVSVSAEQLHGKWVNNRQVWIDSRDPEPDETTYSGSQRYLQLNADGTGMVNPYNLFEAQIRGNFTWSLSGSVLTIKVGNREVAAFTVTNISATNLELTWIDNDEGISIKEVSYFTKATN